AFGGPAQVLDVGERARQPVLVVGRLLGQGLDQGGNARPFLLLCLLALRGAGGGGGLVGLGAVADGAGTRVVVRHHVSSQRYPFARDIRALGEKIKRGCMCPGRGAAFLCRDADPGPPETPSLRRSRVCSAARRSALRCARDTNYPPMILLTTLAV